MAATMKNILVGVEQKTTLEESLNLLLNNISAQLEPLLKGKLTDNRQNEVDDIFTKIQKNIAAVASAITANTQPVPEVVPQDDPEDYDQDQVNDTSYNQNQIDDTSYYQDKKIY